MPIIFEEHFDGPTENLQDIETITVCTGWRFFWYVGNGEDEKPRARPKATIITDPARTPDGETHAQLWYTASQPHASGIKRVLQVAPGQQVTARALYHAWCSNGDDPHVSTEEENWGMYGRIGLDPTGGTDPAAESVIWSEQGYIFDAYDEIAVTAEAQSDEITLFLLSVAKWSSKHNHAHVANVQVSAPDDDEGEGYEDEYDEAVITILCDVLTEIENIEAAVRDLIEVLL
jgi:hypothetical protein